MAINLIKVEKRLHDCEHHLKQLYKFSDSLDVENFEREWFGFLVSLASVRDALNKSTLLDPKLVAWRKDMKNAIHSDALLNYLRCARNTDCHGLESTTGPEVGGAEYLGFAYPNVEFGFDSGQVIKGGAIHLAGDVKEFTFKFILLPVRDEDRKNRSEITIDVPTEHKGHPLSDCSPLNVANAGFNYYMSLARQAAQLAS